MMGSSGNDARLRS